jgi:aryl-alcohol dehydrogenase-like predicted oxidoreductase
LTKIGLGLAALGRPGYLTLGHADDLHGARDPAALERRCHAVLDAAWAGGVRWIDCARSYGRAEEFLAAWLRARAIGPDALTVSSKWGYTYTADWRTDAPVHEVKDHRLPAFERQWRESEALLGRYISVYQIHSATLESGVLDDAAVLSALAGLRARGVTVGLSVSGPRQADVIARALAVRVDGVGLFGAVQATYNLLERSAGAVLAEARDAGWRVIVKEGMANGRLAARGDAAAALERLATEAGVGGDAVALAALVGRPFVDVVLSGAATVAQLESNLAATRVPPEIAAAAWEGVSVEEPNAYWRRRAALPWT